MTMKQVDAVIAIVSGIEGFVPGNKLSRDQMAEAVSLVIQGFNDGSISLSDTARNKYDTEDKLKTYARGLIDNWLRKSPELNGGVKYEVKNPGSRSGSAEYKQALQLKKLLVEQGKDVPEALETFIQQHAPVAKTKEVDLSALPEELKALVG